MAGNNTDPSSLANFNCPVSHGRAPANPVWLPHGSWSPWSTPQLCKENSGSSQKKAKWQSSISLLYVDVSSNQIYIYIYMYHLGICMHHWPFHMERHWMMKVWKMMFFVNVYASKVRCCRRTRWQLGRRETSRVAPEPPLMRSQWNQFQNGSFSITTSSTAQGGGGSFKNRKRIGEIDCCEWRMSEQKHWPTD